MATRVASCSLSLGTRTTVVCGSNAQQTQVTRDHVRRQEHGRDAADRAAEMFRVHPHGTRNVAAVVGGLRAHVDDPQVVPAQVLLQPACLDQARGVARRAGGAWRRVRATRSGRTSATR